MKVIVQRQERISSLPSSLSTTNIFAVLKKKKANYSLAKPASNNNQSQGQ
jgi:hypothetical protein